MNNSELITDILNKIKQNFSENKVPGQFLEVSKQLMAEFSITDAERAQLILQSYGQILSKAQEIEIQMLMSLRQLEQKDKEIENQILVSSKQIAQKDREINNEIIVSSRQLEQKDKEIKDKMLIALRQLDQKDKEIAKQIELITAQIELEGKKALTEEKRLGLVAEQKDLVSRQIRNYNDALYRKTAEISGSYANFAVIANPDKAQGPLDLFKEDLTKLRNRRGN